MRILRLQFLLKLTGGAIIMAPLLAWGHACEYLVARMETEGARIRLEITADYGANPLIADETEARHAIRSILQVLPPAGSPRSLEELAPLKLEHRSAWDPEAPASLSPLQTGSPTSFSPACGSGSLRIPPSGWPCPKAIITTCSCGKKNLASAGRTRPPSGCC